MCLSVYLHNYQHIIPQNVHPTIGKNHCDKRVQKLTEGAALDWATGEALAFGSLLQQGTV